MDRHVNDSLALLPALDVRMEARGADGQHRVVDVGSGAGFPGMMLAIARPDWQVSSPPATPPGSSAAG